MPTYKTLEETRCLWGSPGPLIDEYLESHPDEAQLIQDAMDQIANGPRDLSPDQFWEYMGTDLPSNTYIYQVSDNIVILYEVISLAPVCVLGVGGNPRQPNDIAWGAQVEHHPSEEELMSGSRF